MTRKHTGLDFADMMVEQHGHEALQVALESVRQVHIRLSRKTAGLREVKINDVLVRQDIIDAVCGHFNVAMKDLRVRTRPARIAYIRRVCWALLRDRLGMSLYEIGELFHRDHTTIIQALEHADCRGSDYAAIVDRLEGDNGSNEFELEAAV